MCKRWPLCGITRSVLQHHQHKWCNEFACHPLFILLPQAATSCIASAPLLRLHFNKTMEYLATLVHLGKPSGALVIERQAREKTGFERQWVVTQFVRDVFPFLCSHGGCVWGVTYRFIMILWFSGCLRKLRAWFHKQEKNVTFFQEETSSRTRLLWRDPATDDLGEDGKKWIQGTITSDMQKNCHTCSIWSLCICSVEACTSVRPQCV